MRKQRVSLRARSREDLSKRVQVACIRLAVVGAVILSGLFLFVHSDSWLQRFLKAHTPEIVIQTGPSLPPISIQSTGLRPLWLWVPGMATRMENKLLSQYPELAKVKVFKSWDEKRITLVLQARHPLVQWNKTGMDGEGKLFPVLPPTLASLPPMQALAATPSPELGAWTLALAQSSLWPQVALIKEDARGHWQVVMKNNWTVLWGPAQTPGANSRLKVLLRVLADANSHGEVGRVDLRFFDEGRIIVTGRK